jgi:hypothetical protein
MELAALRAELVAQHDDLRARIAGLLDAADTLPTADAARELDFRTRLAELSDALACHNREEERLLSSLIPTLDAWGHVRKRLMDERHAGEHQAQLAALRSVVDTKPLAAAVDSVRASLHHLGEHIAYEEREILHPDVLRDDCYSIDAAGD